jgi:hypothetical protein
LVEAAFNADTEVALETKKLILSARAFAPWRPVLGPTILRATDPPLIGILAKTIIGDVFMKNMSDPAARVRSNRS